MSRIQWNLTGERYFEAGVDHGVLYPRTGPGVSWNGLISVSEDTSGGDLESLYFDGLKYMDLLSSEDFSASIEAFSTPVEFAPADGLKFLSPGLSVGQQRRETFGLCYRTLIGNDLQGTEYGYKLHLVYNCTASPSNKTNKTIDSGVTAGTRTWVLNTVPPPASTFRPTAHLVVDSTLVDPYLMADLETVLYGRDATLDQVALAPYLPTVQEIVALLGNGITEFIEATI